MTKNELEKSTKTGVAIRTVVILAIVAAFVALIAFSAGKKPSNAEKVWDERTTMGNIDAKNYFVMYTDLACPYCDVFSREVMNHEDEFVSEYIEGKDILYEVRVTDFLYEYGEKATGMSRWAATGAYCATEADKFWEYYHAALSALWDDYHSKGIGVSKNAPAIEGMTKDYWVKIGKEIGFDADEFESCMDSGETVTAVGKNTEKAARVVNGMPYFVFRDFTTSGFDNNWDYSYVKEYFDAGLKS